MLLPVGLLVDHVEPTLTVEHIYGLEMDVLFQELQQQFLLMLLVVEQFALILDKKHNLEIVMDQIYKMKEFIYNIKFLEVYGLILIISALLDSHILDGKIIVFQFQHLLKLMEYSLDGFKQMLLELLGIFGELIMLLLQVVQTFNINGLVQV